VGNHELIPEQFPSSINPIFEPSPMFNLSTLETALAGTIFAGQLHFAPVTESTNTDALGAARSGAPHGSVYFADEQRAGRGRGDHAWHSAAGQGLYVSILLRPSIPAARLHLLPLAAGLAAAHAIHAITSLSVDLRWPNDLLIGPRKVGGVLVEGKLESKTESSAAAYAIVGIGINVHQHNFPEQLPTPATSLDLETASPNSRQQLLIELLKSIQSETLILNDPAAIETIPLRVQQASTWVSGRRVHVHGPQACTGTTAGLDANGFLLVRTAAGLVTVQTGGLRAAEDCAIA
jgi:BirA family transcriptional regulator, biotin operon repressor / biotin---[acetyl-CoA-carboxylase] ligase